MTVLEELYYGRINPFEKRFNRDSEYASVMKSIAECEEKLAAYLNMQPEAIRQQRLLSQLIDAQSKILCFSELDRFIEGFQLGAKFMLDSLIIPQQSVIRDIS